MKPLKLFYITLIRYVTNIEINYEKKTLRKSKYIINSYRVVAQNC